MRTYFVFFLLFTIRVFCQEYSYKNFSVEEGLPQSQVITCYQDRTGYLWFGTQSGGVSRFDGKTFLTLNAKSGLPNNNVQSIYHDKKGNYWFGTDEGLCNFDGKKFWNFGQSYGITRVTKILGGKNDTLWFGDYNKGLFCFDGKNFTRFTKSQGLISNNIRNLSFTHDERLLIAANAGLSIFDGHKFTNFKKIRWSSDRRGTFSY